MKRPKSAVPAVVAAGMGLVLCAPAVLHILHFYPETYLLVERAAPCLLPLALVALALLLVRPKGK